MPKYRRVIKIIETPPFSATGVRADDIHFTFACDGEDKKLLEAKLKKPDEAYQRSIEGTVAHFELKSSTLRETSPTFYEFESDDCDLKNVTVEWTIGGAVLQLANYE